MKTGKQFLLATFAFCMLMFVCASAKADPVTLNLTNPNQVGTIGSVLHFAGSLTNLAAPAVQIVSSQINFNDGGGTLLLDDGPFVANFVFQNIAPGATLGPLEMFSVQILAGAAPGTYNGVLSVLYDNGTAQLETNFFTFSVTVQQPTGEVPEPASLFLLGTGLIAVSGFARRLKARRARAV